MNSMPVANYHVLGDISISNIESDQSLSGYAVVSPAKAIDRLVSNSIRANRLTEGIIVDGYNATLIQFDSIVNNDEKRLAYVKNKLGYYVFVESIPVSKYKYICSKKVNVYIEGQDLVELLIKKFPKSKAIDGVIIDLKGSAEGIVFAK